MDASFVPKVADSGLAKLIGHDFSRALTTIRGTRGYLAPEWISGMAITAKADVYSFGMMLFPTLAARKLIEGDALSLVDQRLEGGPNLKEVAIACKAACRCIHDDENSRPSMAQVV